MFVNKKILIGISGGIAAYKACEIVRELKRSRADVRVVMTDAAKKFISPLTFATLSENDVLTDIFNESYSTATIHIEAAKWADAVLICPATANTIGKIASGIADNLLNTIVCATDASVIFCPAMNQNMYTNPILRNNVEYLKELDYIFVDSEQGILACGDTGPGRLANPKDIIDALKHALFSTDELAEKKILITAGRTEEPLDPIRFITNYSSGKMGFALAEVANLKGADVTLISGPNNLTPDKGINYIEIKTSDDMKNAVNEHLQNSDILIMAAAVADFRPKTINENKIKKSDSTLNLELEHTTDILKEAGDEKENRIHVGFAIETEKEIESAKKKLVQKKLDLIVLNNPLKNGAGFRSDTNIVTLIDKDQNIDKIPCMSKKHVAVKILNKVIDIINSKETC